MHGLIYFEAAQSLEGHNSHASDSMQFIHQPDVHAQQPFENSEAESQEDFYLFSSSGVQTQVLSPRMFSTTKKGKFGTY